LSVAPTCILAPEAAVTNSIPAARGILGTRRPYALAALARQFVAVVSTTVRVGRLATIVVLRAFLTATLAQRSVVLIEFGGDEVRGGSSIRRHRRHIAHLNICVLHHQLLGAGGGDDRTTHLSDSKDDDDGREQRKDLHHDDFKRESARECSVYYQGCLIATVSLVNVHLCILQL